MLDERFYQAISGRVRIGNPFCPHCKKEGAIHEKTLQCCGVTAEPVLVVEPPPVEYVQIIHSPSASTRMVIDPYAVEPTLIPERQSKEQTRKSWIGYLPKAGDITLDVFRCIVDQKIPLPLCPRCRQPFEFRKDASDTEKPFCREKTCQVFFCPSYFSQGSIGKWRNIYEQPFPLEKDEFRLTVKKHDSPHVEPHELRSIGLVSYWQHVAMFAAASVDAEPNNSKAVETDTIVEQHRNLPIDDRLESQPTPEPSNSCAMFISQCLRIDANAFTTRKALYNAYQVWCENNKHIPEYQVELYKHVRLIENVSEPRRRLDGKKLVRGFLGIRL